MKPVVFISSTIVDFRDLRSALKFWLEEFGYEVRISEEAGFPHAVDRAVLEAALAALDGIDYYILLIGERRGTMVQPDDISFTRAELRRARMLWQTKGRPAGFITFVRETVSTMVKSGGAPSGPDPAEWASVKDFLEEAKAETVAGVPHWVDTFATFRDIVDVLRPALRITGRMTRRALEIGLVWETKNNLAELLTRFEGKACSASDVLMAVPDVPPAESSDFGTKIAVPVHATEIMAWYYVVTVPRAGRILTTCRVSWRG